MSFHDRNHHVSWPYQKPRHDGQHVHEERGVLARLERGQLAAGDAVPLHAGPPGAAPVGLAVAAAAGDAAAHEV